MAKSKGRGATVGLTQTKGNEHYLQLKGRYERVLLEILWALRPFLPDDFYFTSVQVNQNSVSEPHTDKNNEGPSVLVSVGDYEGGQFSYVGFDPMMVRNKAVLIDGCQEHHSTPYKGQRWSLVFFTHNSVHKLDPGQRGRLEKLGFKLPPPGVSPGWPGAVAGAAVSAVAAASPSGPPGLVGRAKASAGSARPRTHPEVVNEAGAGPSLPPVEGEEEDPEADWAVGDLIDGQEIDAICVLRPVLFRPKLPELVPSRGVRYSVPTPKQARSQVYELIELEPQEREY